MTDQKFPRAFTETNPTPLYPDEMDLLLRELWDFINDQRMIVYAPQAKPERHQHVAGRDEAFRLILAFIKGAADSSLDGRLRDVDNDDRILATIDAEKGFQL